MEIEPGKAMMINGLTNDVYKTEYPVIEERIYPPLDPIVELPQINRETSTLQDVLDIAREKLGPDAVLEFSKEIVISIVDPVSGEEEFVYKRMASLTESALNTTSGARRQLNLTYRITGDEPYLGRTLLEMDQPPLTILRASNSTDEMYLEITGDKESFFNFDS